MNNNSQKRRQGGASVVVVVVYLSKMVVLEASSSTDAKVGKGTKYTATVQQDDEKMHPDEDIICEERPRQGRS